MEPNMEPHPAGIPMMSRSGQVVIQLLQKTTKNYPNKMEEEYQFNSHMECQDLVSTWQTGKPNQRNGTS